MRIEAEWLQRALRRHARRQYVDDADRAFTSGNLTTQRMDVVRLPLAASCRLDDGEGHFYFLVGLSRIGSEAVVGE
jgi:hypothetical protein